MSFFPKTKSPVFEPTDSQSGVLTITVKSPQWKGDTEKLSTLSHAWLILVEFT